MLTVLHKNDVLVNVPPRVDRPDHYNGGRRFETIDVMEDIVDAIGVNFAHRTTTCLSNTIKYISRAGLKDPDTKLTDLEKAKWYLDRAIKHVRENGR